ncbi:hypothetical protein GAO09_22205 [Rhizobiales bacterium RZME27]|uniref:Uncharacterized protein n=1 Tax=Endobacterium cereale TaxID=2663029 RepID=A0A6A8AG49_9HYPH|nr:hypothetical protein [Endobacterium cereale]MEB2845623.1 hypothetical protein [Endobacterium cereale]MQY48750.1 hypothetical protein [Endobacterium cereale]
MTSEWLFISFGMPAIIAVIAYVAVRLHEWDLDRSTSTATPANSFR